MTIEATQSETTPTEALPFRVTSGAYENLPKMPEEEYPGTDGYIGDVYENPDGSVMCSGYFELNHTDAPLYYEYQYDEMKIVLEGEFLLENKETGQKIVAKAKASGLAEKRRFSRVLGLPGSSSSTQRTVRALLTGFLLFHLTGDKAYREFSEADAALPKTQQPDPDAPAVTPEERIVALLK